jgi:hypothetical protein
MRDGTNLTRRRNVAAALKRAKPDDVLELTTLAQIWGTSKGRFVSVRNEMEASTGFPQPRKGAGNEFVYPAKIALKSMLDFESRHETAARAKAERTAAILGQRGRRASQADPVAMFRPNDLAVMAKMTADIENRERDQGMYAHVAEVALIAGDVFAEISEFFGTLANKLDPHGLLPPETRALIDGNGAEALLGLHKRMNEILSPDAKPRGSRTPSRRSRRA